MKRLTALFFAMAISIGSFCIQTTSAKSNFTEGEYHPIIMNGQLIGGTKDGQWFGARGFWMKYKGKHFTLDNVPPSMYGKKYDISFALAKGKESYKLYSGNEYVAVATGGKPQYSVDGYGNEFYEVQMEKSKNTLPSFDVAISGQWNALPRIPKKIKGQNAYSVDLDGDKKMDTIQVETLTNKEGEGTTKRITVQMGEKKIPVADLVIDGVYAREYSAVTMDLNGDGRLEIITQTQGHNQTINVYDVSRDKAKEVLHFYAGD